ncbi:MAG: AAA family ATPase [Agriterribacter sp.]
MEYIKNIEIKNFKSIQHQTIDDCRRINVFIGYPNVGKSNILEALGLFSFLQLGTEVFDFKNICRVQNFAELFYNQDTKQLIEIAINEKIGVQASLDFNRDLDLNIRLLVDSHGEPDSLLLTKIVIDKQNLVKTSSRVTESNYKHIIENIKKYDFRKEIVLNAQKGLSLSIPFGDNLLDVLQGSSVLRKEISSIFEKYGLRLLIDRVDGTIKFIKEMKDDTAVIIPYHQVADTLQRLIFYKTAIGTNEETALLFEEPEAHMFPPYISKLTSDIIFDENKNQYFITTHSPFVLNDFMEDVDKKELSVYAVGYKKETGETVIRRILEDEIEEIYQHGVDLFFNLENYLKDAV